MPVEETAETKAGGPKPKAKRARSTGNGAATSRRSRTKGSTAPDIQLTGDRLIVQNPEAGERRTAGGLLIPATAAPAPKRLSWGDVALVGPDVRVAKAGDRVLYLPSSGLEVELEGSEYVLLRERDVQAVAAADADAAIRGSGQYL
jgi:chaperonin GroES